MRHYLKYLSSFFFPVCVVWFLAAGPHAAGAAIAWTLPLWLLLAVDWFSPKIDPEQRGQVLADGYYDAILYFLAFLAGPPRLFFCIRHCPAFACWKPSIILSALENLAARNSRLIETYHILTNAYGIFWCYCFAKL